MLRRIRRPKENPKPEGLYVNVKAARDVFRCLSIEQHKPQRIGYVFRTLNAEDSRISDGATITYVMHLTGVARTGSKCSIQAVFRHIRQTVNGVLKGFPKQVKKASPPCFSKKGSQPLYTAITTQ